MTPHLPQLVTWLNETLKHPKVCFLAAIADSSDIDVITVSGPIHHVLDSRPILKLDHLEFCG